MTKGSHLNHASPEKALLHIQSMASLEMPKVFARRKTVSLFSRSGAYKLLLEFTQQEIIAKLNSHVDPSANLSREYRQLSMHKLLY